MHIDFGVAVLNFGVTERKKVKNYFGCHNFQDHNSSTWNLVYLAKVQQDDFGSCNRHLEFPTLVSHFLSAVMGVLYPALQCSCYPIQPLSVPMAMIYTWKYYTQNPVNKHVNIILWLCLSSLQSLKFSGGELSVPDTESLTTKHYFPKWIPYWKHSSVVRSNCSMTKCFPSDTNVFHLEKWWNKCLTPARLQSRHCTKTTGIRNSINRPILA